MESNVIYTFPQLIRLRSAFLSFSHECMCVLSWNTYTYFFLFVLIVVYTFLD